jgi:hypothetical protein
MSLEKWVEYGWLRREPTSPSEIKNLLGIVDRSLADSKVKAVSTDLRFIALSMRHFASQQLPFAPRAIAPPPKPVIMLRHSSHWSSP